MLINAYSVQAFLILMEKENAAGKYKSDLNICNSSPAESLNTCFKGVMWFSS